MDENYLDIVRKSLYGNTEANKVKSEQKMPRKERKVKFAADRYSSDSVFAIKEKSEKIQNRKSTPLKKEAKKRKAVTLQNGDGSFEEENPSQKIKNRKATPRKITPKKKKMVITFSSDSFDEDIKDNLLSPSKSEMDVFQDALNKSKKRASLFEDSSDSDESVNQFNLNDFFSMYEPSLNESFTDAHSGINNEFESEYVRDGNFISCNVDNESSDEEEPVVQRKENVILIPIEPINVSDDDSEGNCSEVFVADADEEDCSCLVVSESPPDVERLCIEADYYDLADCKLVVLKENQSLSIYGLMRLQILHGKLEVFGSMLDKTSPPVNLYSPRGSALLQLVNLTTEDTEEGDIADTLSALTLTDVTTTKNCAIVKCTKIDDIRMPLIEKYISQQIFPQVNAIHLPQAIFQPTGSWNVLKENFVWSDILNNIKPNSKLLLAGGKGVGKSTVLRYAINKLLNVNNKVRVIDLDPGQSEFTVPGCVSVVTVKRPIFGPNYTHLKPPDKSLLSDINVGHDPEAYIKCVRSLMAYYNTLDECPTLINYMGFVQGIGLNIISSVLTYVQPTDVIQIRSKYKSKNFDCDLTSDVVKGNCDLFGSDNDAILDYALHVVRAMNDDNEGWSLEPRQSREMCVLAYLGGMVQRGVSSLMSHKLPMYEVNLSSIEITNAEGEQLPPSAINANLVVLCRLEQSSDLFICLGYGIVRGIDLESETLVMLTPEAPRTLEQVSHLVHGSVKLPPSVYMTPDDVKGSIPYVMQGELISLGQITKRTYLPMNKK